MDHPEICGKHEFNAARTWTKDAIDQQSQLRITCDVTDLIPNDPQLCLCHKTLEEKTSESRGRILASCPFAAYVRVVGVQVRDKCDYIYKISTYEACVLSIL